MSEDEVSVGPYGQLDDEQDELLDEESTFAADLDDSAEYDDDDEPLEDEEPFDDEDEDEPDDDEPLAIDDSDDAPELDEPEGVGAVSVPPSAAAEPDDGAAEQLAAIQGALDNLAANIAELSVLVDGMTEVRERLASIETRVAGLALQQQDEPSIAELLGETPPPRASAEPGERDESLADLIGTAPVPLRAVPPPPPVEPAEPEAVATETLEPIAPLLDPMPGIDEYGRRLEEQARPQTEAETELQQESEYRPVPLPVAPPPQSKPPAEAQPAARVEIEPEPPQRVEPAPAPPVEADPRGPVPLRPAAFAAPDAPAAPQPAASDGRFGLGSSVSLRVAPVSGFQELTRVQGALSQARVVRRATVEAYSRGEARLMVELAEATSATSLAESLGANLNRVAVVREVSEEQQMMKIMLG